MLGVVVIAWTFPALRHYDTQDWTSAPTGDGADRIQQTVEAVELT
jgi:hypothetical protein